MALVLIVIDAQNEFSATGKRPVPNHTSALAAISITWTKQRSARTPIEWVRRHNKPYESPAFVPGTWGAEFSAGLGPRNGFGPEALFEKDVYGAFTTTGLETWLRTVGATHLLMVGFYAHMCLSTSVREALIRGFEVYVDVEATGARALDHQVLGSQSAAEVRRSALLQLANMGAMIVSTNALATAVRGYED
jgi:nicotinamidase-related amidase